MITDFDPGPTGQSSLDTCPSKCDQECVLVSKANNDCLSVVPNGIFEPKIEKVDDINAYS